MFFFDFQCFSSFAFFKFFLVFYVNFSDKNSEFDFRNDVLLVNNSCNCNHYLYKLLLLLRIRTQ